jgi:hypothetical protein
VRLFFSNYPSFNLSFAKGKNQGDSLKKNPPPIAQSEIKTKNLQIKTKRLSDYACKKTLVYLRYSLK